MLTMDIPDQSSTASTETCRTYRSTETNGNGGQLLTFHHTLDIYLKDSNAYANTYFSRYFEWQGICRERWFHECIAPDMLQSLGLLITKHAEQDYIRETFPFQKVECFLNTYQVRKCSASLLFRFFVADNLVSVGRQKLVFANHARQVAPFPIEIIEKVKRYEIATPDAVAAAYPRPAG
jgi:acyl-CoA thioesterase FadM